LTTDGTAGGVRVAAPPLSGDIPDELTLRRLREGVLWIARRLAGDAMTAEDICNEAFRRLFDRLRQGPLSDPDKLPAFLAQTARHVAMEHRRSIATHRTSTGQDRAIADVADPNVDDGISSVLAATRAKAIRQVLQELPTQRDRTLLVRFYLRDEAKMDICRDLGLTEEHFNRVIFRARERLRSLLERRYANPRDLYCLVAL
jgi:RNA polymerase sigma-70 factor (ECF subfamily)